MIKKLDDSYDNINSRLNDLEMKKPNEDDEKIESFKESLPKSPASKIIRGTIGIGNRITNDEVTDFINDYYKPLSLEFDILRKYGEFHNVPIILKETENYLNTFLDLIKPKKILEIGTAIGYSALYFASKCKDAEVYTVEKDEAAYEEAKDIISNFIDVKNIDSKIYTFVGDGEEVIETLYKEGDKDFDLIFIDAAKSHYLRFFKAALNLSKKGTVIICDNVLMHGMTVYYDIEKYRKHRTNVKRMREFIDYIMESDSLETSLLAIGDGMSISIVK